MHPRCESPAQAVPANAEDDAGRYRRWRHEVDDAGLGWSPPARDETVKRLGGLTPRVYFSSVLVACGGLLGFGLYLEHVTGLVPCPLCILQRIAYIAIACLALVAALHGPRRAGLRAYSALLGLLALGGGGSAARQVYLQHLPADRVPECGPGLEYILDVFPWRDALGMILSGSGECAEVQWRFAGLSIAEWSLVNFALLLIVAALAMVFARRFAEACP